MGLAAGAWTLASKRRGCCPSFCASDLPVSRLPCHPGAELSTWTGHHLPPSFLISPRLFSPRLTSPHLTSSPPLQAEFSPEEHTICRWCSDFSLAPRSLVLQTRQPLQTRFPVYARRAHIHPSRRHTFIDQLSERAATTESHRPPTTNSQNVTLRRSSPR